MPSAGPHGPSHPEAVALTGADAGHDAEPGAVACARSSRTVCARGRPPVAPSSKSDQVDPVGVPGVDGEVDPVVVQRGAERRGKVTAGAHGPQRRQSLRQDHERSRHPCPTSRPRPTSTPCAGGSSTSSRTRASSPTSTPTVTWPSRSRASSCSCAASRATSRSCGSSAQWRIGEDVPQDLLTQLQACNDLTLRLNIVKAGIANDTLVVTGEHVVSPETDVAVLLQVTDRAGALGVHMWHEQITGGPRRRRRPTRSRRDRLRPARGRGRRRHDPARPAADERAQRRRSRRRSARPRPRRPSATTSRAVVVYGGEKVFAAGADIKEMAGHVLRRHGRALRRAAVRVHAPSPGSPSRSSPRSPATRSAAAASWRWRCDFRVAADDAKLGQPEILLGIIPGAGGTQRLTRLVGPARAKDIIFTGRFVDAPTRRCAIGLVDEVVPPTRCTPRRVARAAPVRRRPGVRAAGRQGGDRPRPRGRPRHRPGDRADAVRRRCSPPRTGRSA